MKEVKEKVIGSLSRRAGKVTFMFGSDKDENFAKYKYGEITLVEFLKNSTEDSPYHIVETTEDNFIIVDKATKIPPQTFIDRKLTINLFSAENKPLLVKAYPEIAEFIEETYTQISSATCSSCAKNSKSNSFIQKIIALDNKNRDLVPLEAVLGKQFIKAIKGESPTGLLNPGKKPVVRGTVEKPIEVKAEVAKPEKVVKPVQPEPVKALEIEKPVEPVVAPAVLPVVGAASPRPSCVSCCMKHVGTSVVLLEEASNGYPVHRWLAVGELNEAANEIAADYPDIAVEIRSIRHQITEGGGKVNIVMSLLGKLHERFFDR